MEEDFMIDILTKLSNKKITSDAKKHLEKYKEHKEFCYKMPKYYTSWSSMITNKIYIIIGKGKKKNGNKYLENQNNILNDYKNCD